jgi:hypothetical protein
MGIKYSGQDVEVKVYNTKDGRWAIDKETGKELMHIKLIDKNSKRVLDYVPSHTDVYEIVKKLLDAEEHNDSYKFENPKMDKHRKPQLPQKLDKLREIIIRYDKDGKIMENQYLEEDAKDKDSKPLKNKSYQELSWQYNILVNKYRDWKIDDEYDKLELEENSKEAKRMTKFRRAGDRAWACEILLRWVYYNITKDNLKELSSYLIYADRILNDFAIYINKQKKDKKDIKCGEGLSKRVTELKTEMLDIKKLYEIKASNYG